MMWTLLACLALLSSLKTLVAGQVQVHFSDTAPFPKYVVAHFMVGNTFPYAIKDWAKDIALAEKKGIDGFVLNVGSDSWQRARVADAYEAAQQNGQGFKLFMSFDMSSMPCSNPEDGKKLREYITTYQSHPNQLKYKNAILASTFAGQDCRFGAKSLNEGWRNTLKTGLPPVHFVPSFFVDPATFGGLNVMDGSFRPILVEFRLAYGELPH